MYAAASVFPEIVRFCLPSHIYMQPVIFPHQTKENARGQNELLVNAVVENDILDE